MPIINMVYKKNTNQQRSLSKSNNSELEKKIEVELTKDTQESKDNSGSVAELKK